jgi:outer membrane lipoprotein
MRRLGMRMCGLALAVVLGGCASAFPREVMRDVATAVTAADLRRDPVVYKGARVIVGGEILSTQPKTGQTEIELLARRLRDDDSPEQSDRSPGRLLLRSPDFLDPAVYAPGRRITVIGTVSGEEERKVGELPYRYPVITVERIRLWAQDVGQYGSYYPWPGWPYGPYYGPYYYDPYYFGPRTRLSPHGWWW